jgi:hypothetical protein
MGEEIFYWLVSEPHPRGGWNFYQAPPGSLWNSRSRISGTTGGIIADRRTRRKVAREIQKGPVEKKVEKELYLLKRLGKDYDNKG